MSTDPRTRPVVGDPAWRLIDDQGYLVVTAGADEVWVIDDLPGGLAVELQRCWSDDPPHPGELSAQAQRAVEQLRALGAIRIGVDLPPSATPALAWHGAPSPTLRAALDHAWPGAWTSDGELTLVVRTTATLRSLADEAATWVSGGRPHLLLDLAAHHTIALGPLVIPGHTSCLGCAAGRVGSRWGDPVPPTSPATSSGTGAQVAAGLAVHHLRRALAGHYDLANRTVSLDLDTMTTTASPCLRYAGCPWCAGLRGDGRLDLPWARPSPPSSGTRP